MDLASLPQLWALVIGLALPGLTSIIQQPHWSRPVRVAVAVAAAAVMGTATVVLAGQFNPADWITTVTAVLIASQTAYESLWQPSGAAAAIEYRTSGFENPEVTFQAEVDDYDLSTEDYETVEDEEPVDGP